MNRDQDIRWEVENDLLFVRRGSEREYPSAEQIYESVFEKKAVIPGIEPGRPVHDLGILFSKYPAQLSIEIDYIPNPDGADFSCAIKAGFKNEERVVDGFLSREIDHIVIAGKWYPLAVGAIDQIRQLLDVADVSDTDRVTFRSFLNLRRAAEQTDLIEDLTVGRVVQPGLEVARDESDLALFQGSLYPYQEQGWQWLSFVCREKLGCVLADEMGLGKTVQIIAALASPSRESVVPSVVIAPTTLLENWRRELAKFSPSLRVAVHQGPYRTGLPSNLASSDVVVTSYETVVRDSSLFEMIDWKIVVLDEAQAIKNPETRRSNAVKRLNRDVGIAVTGTPIENRLRDLWSILEFALPGYLGSEKEFEQRFEDTEVGASLLEPFVSPLVLRRRVSEVAGDLPPRIDIPEALSLSAEEAAEYEQVRRTIASEYGEAAKLVALTKLRMFCAHPLLTDDAEREKSSVQLFSKFRRLFEIAEEIFQNKEKVLVFTSYNRMSDLIVDHARSIYRVFAASIDGRTPVAERQEMVDSFTDHSGAAILTLNPRAAGTGLNITAANHVIHYNLEWNPAVEDQASARAYRRGQAKPVTVHRLFFADTVEEVIDDRLERKRAMADTAVVGVTGKRDEIDDILRALQLSPSSAQEEK